MTPRSGLLLLLGWVMATGLSCAPTETVAHEPSSPNDGVVTGEEASNTSPTTQSESAETSAPDHQEPVEANDDAPTGADVWLERLEAKSKEVQTLRARIKYVTVQGLLQDEQARFGELTYAAPTGEQPERFAIHLDREMIDDKVEPVDRWVIFDGRWLLDRDEDARQATRREVVSEGEADAPDADAALPIPLRIDRAKLTERYRVALGESNADEPELVRLDFEPRRSDDDRPLAVWFDRETLLPVRAQTAEDDGDETTVQLIDPHINVEIPDDAFDTAPPTARGWDVQVVPLD